jgi:putative heme iron utilization protein
MSATLRDLGREARLLMRGCRSAALATAAQAAEGWAYASLVTVAFASDGSPLLLFSDMSDHTRNLMTDPRASLLFEQAHGRRNPQTGPRATVMGKIRKTNDKALAKRFLARHPQAAMYAEFGDFNFYRMSVERVHSVGGFASARWIGSKDFLLAGAGPKAVGAAEEDVMAHMNSDHIEAVRGYAKALLKRRGDGWTIAGVDPDGIDLTVDGRFARLNFGVVATGAGDLRSELIRLAAEARNGA